MDRSMMAMMARARAKENSFFRDQQEESAKKLRESLPPQQVEKLREEAREQRTSAEPCIDRLMEVSAHDYYDNVIRNGATRKHVALEQKASMPSFPHARVRQVSTIDSIIPLESLAKASLDLRAKRFNFHRMTTIPDSLMTPSMRATIERHLEGSLMGASAFAIATLLVGGVGALFMTYTYKHPETLDRVRNATVKTRDFVGRHWPFHLPVGDVNGNPSSAKALPDQASRPT